MKVFRITRKVHANISGEGCIYFPARWNNKGKPLVYTAESISLSALEFFVNIGSYNLVPDNLVLLTIEVDDNTKMIIQDPLDLPKEWKNKINVTRKLGDDFIKEAKAAIMKVPSAIIDGEYNFIINPKHQEADKVRILSIKPFTFDSRFFKKK